MDELWVGEVAAQPTLVVRAVTTWTDLPALWPRLLDEVWAVLRAAGVHRGCPNVMLYRDDRPEVEIGVLRADPRPTGGRVVPSVLPGGRVARLRHRGPYGDLHRTHRRLVAGCAARGLGRAGPRWEVYGPHRDDPAQVWVDVTYLLAAPAPGDHARSGPH